MKISGEISCRVLWARDETGARNLTAVQLLLLVLVCGWSHLYRTGCRNSLKESSRIRCTKDQVVTVRVPSVQSVLLAGSIRFHYWSLL